MTTTTTRESSGLADEIGLLLRLELGIEAADDTDLIETGLLDSLLVMDLVLLLEETFGAQIHDVDITPSNFATVSSLAALVTPSHGEPR